MKKLKTLLSASSHRVFRRRVASYPNVAPDPSMYWPSVRIIPLGPAPYLKMLTVPAIDVRAVHLLTLNPRIVVLLESARRTKDEADDATNS